MPYACILDLLDVYTSKYISFSRFIAVIDSKPCVLWTPKTNDKMFVLQQLPSSRLLLLTKREGEKKEI